MRRLTAPEKVILHLYNSPSPAPPDENFTVEHTQDGISRGTGIIRNHIPRTIKVLREKKMVEESKWYIAGYNRQLKVYRLTPLGYSEAKALVSDIEDEGITVRIKGTNEEIEVSRALEYEGVDMGDIIRSDGFLDLDSLRRMEMHLGEPPDITEFYNRNVELGEIEEFMEGDARILVIYGGIGTGASSLAARAVSSLKGKKNIAWVSVDSAPIDKVRAFLSEFSEEIGSHFDGLSSLHGFGVLLVLDNWYDVSDDMVEYFAEELKAIKRTDIKIIVTSLENTPSYNRFYRIDDIGDGSVEELHIRGLEPEYCRKLLGNVDDDALKKIFMMTHGRPLYINLLKKGDVDALLAVSSFTPEEVRYLMFLAGVRP